MGAVLCGRLDALTGALAEVCALAGQVMQYATQALLQADVARAEVVIGESDKIMLTAARAEQDPLPCWLCRPAGCC